MVNLAYSITRSLCTYGDTEKEKKTSKMGSLIYFKYMQKGLITVKYNKENIEE